MTRSAGPARPAGLTLEDSKLVTEGKDLGFKPGLGPAADNEELEQETGDGVHEGLEHDRGNIAQASAALRDADGR
jgi:hypothetical protein